MARTPNPKRRSLRAREAILSAAYELCQEHGYGRLTIEAIAARAGVGKQTVYRWWPSKGCVTLDVFLEMLMRQLEPSLAAKDDFLTTFRRRLHALVDALGDDQIGPHIAAIIGEAQTDPHLTEQLMERLVTPAREQHRPLIEDAQARGEIRADIDADTIADLLFGPIWFRMLVTRQSLARSYADTVLDVAMTGLAPGPRADPLADRAAITVPARVGKGRQEIRAEGSSPSDRRRAPGRHHSRRRPRGELE